MANTESAKAILKEVGGADNVELLTNCATRLRFTLWDASKADKGKIEKIPGVMAAIAQGDKSFQVVIGPAVEDMRKEIEALPEMKGGAKKAKVDNRSIEEIKAEQRSKVRGKKGVDAFFEYLSDSFRPIIGVLLAASLIIAVINVVKFCGFIESETSNTTVLFFFAISKSVFQFIGIFVAYNACKKLKVDPWIGVTIMLVFMTTQFFAISNPEAYQDVFDKDNKFTEIQNILAAQGNCDIEFLQNLGIEKVITVMGLPMISCEYAGNVFIPLLMCPILALLYKGVKKVLPSSVHLIFVPVICVVVMSIVTAFIIGPIGTIAGSALAKGFGWLNSTAPLVLIFIIPMLYPFLVPLGLHWPLNALMLANISSLGYDFIQGPMGIYDFACYGASFGVLLIALWENNKQMKAIAGGAVLAGLLGGISEPSLYGIHLRYKKAYPIMIAGCVAGALTIGLLGMAFPSSEGVAGVTTRVFAFTSLITIPVFDQMWVYAASIGVAFIVPAILVVLIDYRTAEQKAEMMLTNAANNAGLVDLMDSMNITADQAREMSEDPRLVDLSVDSIVSPIKGVTKDITEVKDKAFSKKIFGNGIAIEAKDDTKREIVQSPVYGVVHSIASAKHAFSLTTYGGAVMLIHVGVDAVKLDGDGFHLWIKEGDVVAPGAELVSVDYEKLRAADVKPEVIVTVCNEKELNNLTITEAGKAVEVGDEVMHIDY